MTTWKAWTIGFCFLPLAGAVDWGQIEAAGLDKTTMVIFTNTKDVLSGFEVKYGSANARDELGQASVK